MGEPGIVWSQIQEGRRSLSSLLRDCVLGPVFKQVVRKYYHRVKGCLDQWRRSYLCRKHLVSVLCEIRGSFWVGCGGRVGAGACLQSVPVALQLFLPFASGDSP